MNSIYLPQLKSIHLRNYSLYPNGKGLDFKHNFVDGINLIVGGNGMGKTTFVNLIKYSIIGHYKKRYDYTRTYKSKAITKRTSNPWNYFTKRKDPSIETAAAPTIIVVFFINGVEFEVERDLLVKGAWPYKPQPPPVLEPH